MVDGHPMNTPPPYHANLPTETKADRELLNARGLLQNFFAAVALACANRGFEVVNSKLIFGLFANAGKKVDIESLQAAALPYGLTVTKTFTAQTFESSAPRVVFRVLHLPDNRHAEEFLRAGGDLPCDLCRFPLREHPRDLLFSWLRVRCDGRRIKL